MTRTTTSDEYTPGQQVDLAEGFLALRSFGLTFTETLETEVGVDYGDNGTLVCLAIICERGPLRLRDLTGQVSASGPTASRFVDRLVRAGDVVRTRGDDDGDRRTVLMVATASGRRRLEQIDRSLTSGAEEIGASLKESIVNLERLVPADRPGEVNAQDVPVGTRSLVGRLAEVGIAAGDALRSMSPSGDLAETLALFTLAVSDESRPRHIAERVGLTSGGTTKLLDRLEAQGLIERTFGLADDRRGVAITLTDQGRDRLVDIGRLATPLLPAALDALLDANERLDRGH